MRRRGLKNGGESGTYDFPDLLWGAVDFDFGVDCHF